MFKTFPEFTKLKLSDKEAFEDFVKDFPPYADLSFASIMTWWNSMDQAAVSMLNDNVVIPYWVPGFELKAGLALVGTNRVDESLCVIFDYLAGKGERPRVIGVPEFVVSHIRFPELFSCRAQRADYEYILEIDKFADFERMTGWKKQKIQRQLQKLDGLDVTVRPLNFQNTQERKMFLETVRVWWDKNINTMGGIEWDALTVAVEQYRVLGFDSIALFIEGRLQGFCLYRRPSDKRYAVVHFIKATSSKMLRFELIGHLFGKYLHKQGVKFVNINTDAGQLHLRMFMLTLGPVNFLRRYIVEPL